MLKLTSVEIEPILDFIKENQALPNESAKRLQSLHKDLLSKQLLGMSIYPKMIPKLKKQLEDQYFKTLIQSGESVGVIAAQSIGERQTQSTLNTFHACGLAIKAVVSGVPRFTELLSATKDPKSASCQIALTENLANIKDVRRHIGNTLKYTCVKDVTTRYDVLIDVEQPWYNAFKILYNSNFENLSMCLRIHLNLKKLCETYIDILDIALSIEKEYNDLVCVWSPQTIGIIEIFADLSKIVIPEGHASYIHENSKYNLYVEEVMIPSIENIKIGGISGITEIFIEKNESNKWRIITDGTNFIKILGHPLVDFAQTVSNDMWEIYNVLGLEAARQFLIEEFTKVINEGAYVNNSHILLLVDIMTFTGSISSVSRYGLKKEQCGPLAKASFEESLDHLLRAGVYGESETTNGVSASIMLGKIARLGTGVCDLAFDV